MKVEEQYRQMGSISCIERAEAQRKRCSSAYEMRSSGETFLAIGRKLGISTERARQLVRYGTPRDAHWTDGLSSRAKNLLKNMGVQTPEELYEFVSKHRSFILHSKNIGRQTMHELDVLLGKIKPTIDLKAAISMLENLGYSVTPPRLIVNTSQ